MHWLMESFMECLKHNLGLLPFLARRYIEASCCARPCGFWNLPRRQGSLLHHQGPPEGHFEGNTIITVCRLGHTNTSLCPSDTQYESPELSL